MSLLWLRVAVILYGIAALAVLPAALYDRPRWRHIAVPAALGGVFFHFVSIVETLIAAHRALPVDTHEALSWLGLLLAAAFLLLAVRFRTVSFGIFLLPVAVLLAIVPAFHPGNETLASPQLGLQLRTGWLLLHIALLLAAYAALFLSLVASLLYLIQERRLKQKASIRTPRLPPLETLAHLHRRGGVVYAEQQQAGAFRRVRVGLVAHGVLNLCTAESEFAAHTASTPRKTKLER